MSQYVASLCTAASCTAGVLLLAANYDRLKCFESAQYVARAPGTA
jgi:hypothetical protein